MRSFAPFGSEITFAEPSWYQGWPSPYYNDSHVRWRAYLRDFFDKNIRPHVSEWDENPERMPVKELCKKMVQAGLYGLSYPAEFVPNKPKDFDAFHALIFGDEMSRIGSGGVQTALMVGIGIGLGPVNVGAKEPLRSRVMKEVLNADKFICLAITEPQAGSDVSGIRTTAKLDETGQFYIVNGEKKFISGAGYADYFTTAVQTESGVSVLLVERGPGVSVRRLKTQGWLASYTGFVVFENVRVPRSNILGEEGAGFKIIMHNFNGERLGIIVQAMRHSRTCLEEAVRYAKQRTTFGRPLWSSQVIRSKVAEMARRIESAFAWAEQITYATQCGTPQGTLAGAIALCKVQATQTFEFCAREASQIMGGASYLRSGPGEVVERLYREVRVLAIGGGSEEVMSDLAMRRLKAKL